MYIILFPFQSIQDSFSIFPGNIVFFCRLLLCLLLLFLLLLLLLLLLIEQVY